MFHVKQRPSCVCTLRLTTFTRDSRWVRCYRDTTSNRESVLCTPPCRFFDVELRSVSLTQSLSAKDSELLQARFCVLNALPDDALNAEELRRADVHATVIDENNVLVRYVKAHEYVAVDTA